MLVLAETSVGFVIFKLNDQAKPDSKDFWKNFETPELASSTLSLHALHRFESAAAAVEDITAIQDGRITPSLQAFLTNSLGSSSTSGTTDPSSSKKSKKSKNTSGLPDSLHEKLIVSDPKLGSTIKNLLKMDVVSDKANTEELFRGIRGQLAGLLGGVEEKDLGTMRLGLGHSLSRFKLKFSTDKVDTMVIQAIALLDDLDKEINIYSMRVKEWYGWHFPEMGKIITDNLAYAKVVKAMGFRTNASSTSLETILPEDLELTLKAAAEISMGTEISDADIAHIHSLCDQVISITEYRAQLSEYLRNRMVAIAPNMTAIVGELVGARLISHSGSMQNLAKHPASTIQILGAEKALFRALKTKHDTPKYGLIYHASLIGQAPQKLKGKMARMVATKTALSIRVDALSDADSKSTAAASEIGVTNRVKLESRLRALEHRAGLPITQIRSEKREQPKFEMRTNGAGYNSAADSIGLIKTQPDVSPEDIAMEIVKETRDEQKADKKEKKKKRKNVGDETADVTMDGEGDEAGETKEQRKARKEAKKAAKALAKSSAELATSTAVIPETPAAAPAAAVEPATNGHAETNGKEKKSKKRKAEAGDESVVTDGGEKRKKSKKNKE